MKREPACLEHARRVRKRQVLQNSMAAVAELSPLVGGLCQHSGAESAFVEEETLFPREVTTNGVMRLGPDRLTACAPEVPCLFPCCSINRLIPPVVDCLETGLDSMHAK